MDTLTSDLVLSFKNSSNVDKYKKNMSLEIIPDLKNI